MKDVLNAEDKNELVMKNIIFFLLEYVFVKHLSMFIHINHICIDFGNNRHKYNLPIP